MKTIKNTAKEIEVYLYMRKRINIKILESTLKKEFGYKSKTSVGNTRMAKYLSFIYRVPGLPKLCEPLDRIYVSEDYETYCRQSNWVSLLRVNTNLYYLTNKAVLPWWLLEEFGGPVKDIPDDFLNYLEVHNV